MPLVLTGILKKKKKIDLCKLRQQLCFGTYWTTNQRLRKFEKP
jgi:hypothetical protein